MSKKKEINSSDLVKIEPITDNQKLVFEGHKAGKNGFLFGIRLPSVYHSRTIGRWCLGGAQIQANFDIRRSHESHF